MKKENKNSEKINIDKIAVLLPYDNESKTIEKVITDWEKSLSEAIIYVYPNNSCDGTACETVRNTQIVGLSSFKLFVCLENDGWCYVRYLAENYIWNVSLSVTKSMGDGSLGK